MKIRFKNIISYIVVSTILFTNTLIYADDIKGQVINENKEIHKEKEILKEELENPEKLLEIKEEIKQPVKIDIKDETKNDIEQTPKKEEEVVKEIESILEEIEEVKEEKMEEPEEEEVITVKPKKFVNSSNKYTLKQIENDIRKISTHYKDIVNVEVIGKSYEGRPINAIKLSVPSKIKKPSVLLMGNIHAREDFSATLVMKMLDYITYSYYDTGIWGNYNVREILDQVDIHFIPVANPDGLNIAHHGIKASSNYNYLKKIPNRAKDDRWWKSNARGVDLNRNFDDGNWHRRSNAGPSSEGYRGASPNSEVETKAIQKFCREQNPLLAISYHTSGNLFYWADKDTHSNFKGYDRAIVNRMRNITGYKVMPVSQNPSSFGGGFENWFKKEFNRFGMCVELSPSPGRPFVQHADNKFNSLVWSRAQFTGIQLALEGIDIEDKMFNVYQGEKHIKTFYSQAEAFTHAKKYLNTTVRVTAYDVYQNDKYLKTFYNYKSAKIYSNNFTGIRIDKKQIKVK